MAEWLAAFPPAPIPNPQDRARSRLHNTTFHFSSVL
jgi:hypothetical protein